MTKFLSNTVTTHDYLVMSAVSTSKYKIQMNCKKAVNCDSIIMAMSIYIYIIDI